MKEGDEYIWKTGNFSEYHLPIQKLTCFCTYLMTTSFKNLNTGILHLVF